MGVAAASVSQDELKGNKTDDILIHVRFMPNAEIFSIDMCPENLTSREWLNRLYEKASLHYQTFANGRGFFRIPHALFETI